MAVTICSMCALAFLAMTLPPVRKPPLGGGERSSTKALRLLSPRVEQDVEPAMPGVGDPVRARAQLRDARVAVGDPGIRHAQRATSFLQFHDQIENRRHVALVSRSPESFYRIASLEWLPKSRRVHHRPGYRLERRTPPARPPIGPARVCFNE